MRPVAPDGRIHAHLAGKQIRAARKDGHYLIIETECGHAIKIGWRTDDGQSMHGEPVFVSQGVQIVLPSVGTISRIGGIP